MFFTSENLKKKCFCFRVNNSLVIDLPRQTEVFEAVSDADDLLVKLNATLEQLQGTWPLWEVRSCNVKKNITLN